MCDEAGQGAGGTHPWVGSKLSLLSIMPQRGGSAGLLSRDGRSFVPSMRFIHSTARPRDTRGSCTVSGHMSCRARFGCLPVFGCVFCLLSTRGVFGSGVRGGRAAASYRYIYASCVCVLDFCSFYGRSTQSKNNRGHAVRAYYPPQLLAVCSPSSFLLVAGFLLPRLLKSKGGALDRIIAGVL